MSTFIRGQVGQPPVQHRLGRRDELDDRMSRFGDVLLDRGQHRRQLHRDQELAEEALLGALEAGERRALGLTIERPAAHPVNDIGFLEDVIEVLVDQRLSRGSGNAEERGVVLQSCGTFRHVLHIIL